MKLAEKTVDKTVKNYKNGESTKFAQSQPFVTFSIFVSEKLKNTNIN